MRLQLVVVSGPDQGKIFSLSEGHSLLVGRAESVTFRLADPRVSRKHCRVVVDEGMVRLQDEGSRGGTFVNGRRITRHNLKPGDVVCVGNTELRLQWEPISDGPTLLEPGEVPRSKPAPNIAPLLELVGKKIAHFAIQKHLATGTSGLVFRALDAKRDRLVALKVLWPEISQNEAAVQRFVRAMKAMLPIQHPNIVRLHEAGKSKPYCWLAMEYVEGENLTEVIARAGTAGMLDWRYAFRVAVDIARALEAAYEHRIIHRNITPANILVRSSDGVAKLGDLMLAKALSGSLARQITRPGELVGDVHYMSPERTRNQAEVDTRSDIYSLGATLYGLLAGRPPFEGKSLPEVIGKIREAEPVPPKKYQLAIYDLFENVVLRMLQKRPDDRYQTPGELLSELERIGGYQGLAV